MADYTKLAEAEPLKTEDVKTVASLFFNRWICRHGVIDPVHSNQGPDFNGLIFNELCRTFGIPKTRTTPGHPQGNG
ncbi:Gag-Pol polyprotein [Taenia solium]|eukprot:TsM_001190900 transcript=TsM_001190900 gene=TsM_001190900